MMLGEAYAQEIPLGIHSSHKSASPVGAAGIFFAFRVEDRVLRRVYRLVGYEWLT